MGLADPTLAFEQDHATPSRATGLETREQLPEQVAAPGEHRPVQCARWGATLEREPGLELARDPAPDVIGVTDAIARSPLQHRRHQCVQRDRNPGDPLAQRPIVVGGRRLADEQLVQDAAERVEIGAGVAEPAGELLRRHVRQRAGHRARLDHRTRVAALAMGQAQVDDHRPAVGADEDVRGLQVAMDQPAFVQCRERFADRSDQLQDRTELGVGPRRSAWRLRPGRERLALDDLHREPRTPRFLTVGEHADDAIVTDPAERMHLGAQAGQGLGRRTMHGLHRDGVASLVERAIHDAGAASTQWLGDAIRPEPYGTTETRLTTPANHPQSQPYHGVVCEIVAKMTSRVRVEIKTWGPSATHAVTLGDGESALVGRDPDPDAMAGVSQLVTVTSPNVSANHVSIRRDGDELSLVERGSRNGTWLRLPTSSEVRFKVPNDDVALQIAPPFDQALGLEGPDDAQWANAAEYATSLQREITRWLAVRNIAARATIVPGVATHANRPGRLALATGEDLIVEVLETADSSWLQWLAMLERYVMRHNVLFDTEQSMREDGLVVASPAMRHAVARVIAAAASGARVLMLTGPSGSGKEGLARCFHRHTARPGPFVARNCAMFSRDLVRSELFGAERGAFTGSVQRIVGAVEIANEGTLFLDELAELPREIQPMLLRFLDHGEYERVGNAGSQRADVRIVCATNRDLRLAALADDFRTDLWFRLSVHVVDVPPLYDRPEDIVAFLSSRPRGAATLFDALQPDARALLNEHDWPGNFRELHAFAERLSLAVRQGPISAGQARAALAEGSLVPLAPPTPAPAGPRPETVVAPAERASTVYLEDHGRRPETWDEVKDFVENYLKPVMFAELSAIGHLASFEAVELREVANRVQSDRGTAAKQLRRYFDRFVRAGS